MNSLNQLFARTAGQFTVFQGTDSQWYFRLRAPNGETICHSEGYTSRQGVLNGINAVKTYATGASVEG
ncbi:MAG: YegP family protein [Luteimonas sp.]